MEWLRCSPQCRWAVPRSSCLGISLESSRHEHGPGGDKGSGKGKGKGKAYVEEREQREEKSGWEGYEDEDDDEDDAFVLAPTLGVEYFISANFTFGGECMYSMVTSEDK